MMAISSKSFVALLLLLGYVGVAAASLTLGCQSPLATSTWSMAFKFDNEADCNSFAVSNLTLFGNVQESFTGINAYQACGIKYLTYCMDGPDGGNWVMDLPVSTTNPSKPNGVTGLQWSFIYNTTSPYMSMYFQLWQGQWSCCYKSDGDKDRWCNENCGNYLTSVPGTSLQLTRIAYNYGKNTYPGEEKKFGDLSWKHFVQIIKEKIND